MCKSWQNTMFKIVKLVIFLYNTRKKNNINYKNIFTASYIVTKHMFQFTFLQAIIEVINHGSHQTKCSNAQQIRMHFNAVCTYNIVNRYLWGWVCLFAIFNYIDDIKVEKMKSDAKPTDQKGNLLLSQVLNPPTLSYMT